MRQRRFIPRRGDIIRIKFDPQAGKEIKKPRPAVVLSHANYNICGLAVVCPITSDPQGIQANRPFRVKIPSGLRVKEGVILVDQIKSLDWEERNATFKDRLPHSALREVLRQINALLTRDDRWGGL